MKILIIVAVSLLVLSIALCFVIVMTARNYNPFAYNIAILLSLESNVPIISALQVFGSIIYPLAYHCGNIFALVFLPAFVFGLIPIPILSHIVSIIVFLLSLFFLAGFLTTPFSYFLVKKPYIENNIIGYTITIIELVICVIATIVLAYTTQNISIFNSIFIGVAIGYIDYKGIEFEHLSKTIMPM